MLALDEHHEGSQWLLHEHLFVAVTCCASCFLFETNMVEETSLVVHLGRNSLPSWGSLPRHAFPLVSLGGGHACRSALAHTHARTVVAAQSVRFYSLFRLCTGPTMVQGSSQYGAAGATAATASFFALLALVLRVGLWQVLPGYKVHHSGLAQGQLQCTQGHIAM